MKAANLTGSVSRKAGGLFESVRRLVQTMEEAQIDVRVFGIADEFTLRDVKAWSPVRVDAFATGWPARLGYSRELAAALEDYGPDITHTHGLWLYPSLAACRYQRRHRTPHVISTHGMLDAWALRNSRWKKFAAWWLYERRHLGSAGCLRALCEGEATAFRAMGLSEPVAIIPNGVDLPEMHRTDEQERPAWDAETGKPREASLDGRRVLLFLSRVHPKKGLANLLRAWKAARPPNEWLLVIAGWDQDGHQGELKRSCGELGLRWEETAPDERIGLADAFGGKGTPHPPFRLRQGCGGQVGHPRPVGGGEGRGEGAIPGASIGQRYGDAQVLFAGPQFGTNKDWWYRRCDGFILPSLSEGVPMAVLEAWSYGKPVLMTPECNLPEGFAAGAAIEVNTSVEGLVEGLRELFGSRSDVLTRMGANGRRLVQSNYSWERVARQMSELYRWLLGGGERPRFVDGDRRNHGAMKRPLSLNPSRLPAFAQKLRRGEPKGKERELE